MYLIAKWTNTERLILNIDYFFPLIFLALRSNILFLISFVIVSFFDFLIIFSQIFPFIHLSDLFYLLKFSFISSNIYKIYGIVIFSFLVLQIYLIIRIFRIEFGKVLLIYFNICIFSYAFYVNFAESKGGKFWKPEESQVIASQALNYFDYRNKGFIKTYNMDGDAFQNVKIEGATHELFKTPFVANRILLIVNESWGVPLEKNIQNSVLEPLLKNNRIDGVKQGSLNFEGFTIAGELRELCQKVVTHFNLKNQEIGFEKCLPNIYRHAGYKTISVHGALGLMYDRQYWYPRAGFRKMMFRDNELNLPYSHCYSFPGNCDQDIAIKIEQQFKENEKIFLYWLTLNTHALYDERDLKVDLFDCEKYNVDVNTGSCRNLKLQTQYFDTLSKLVSSPHLKGTKVIVVGDHKPPIISEEISLFHEAKVPIVEFNVL